MASGKVYSEIKLDLTTQSVRLAKIIYSNRQDGSYIQLKLQTFPLSSSPPYNALSYVWGLPSPCRTVMVNSERLQIRENLWYFLWQASIPEGCEYLWIDALCINQDDTNEKNHQVRMMGKIYSQASMVLVWLGVAADNSDSIMDFMHNCGIRVDPSIDNHLQWYTKIKSSKQDLAEYDPCCITTSSSILSFFKRNYWKRMWIVQELCLAKDCRILCGTKVTEYLSLLTLWSSSVSLFANDYLSSVLNLVQRPVSGKIPTYYLRDLLIYTRPHECNEKHDKVYALLGLLKDDTYDIPIDYDCTLGDLYAQVLRTMFIFDYGSFNMPMKLELLRKSLSIGELDETAKLETNAYLSCCERLELAADSGSRLWYMHEEAWKAGKDSGQGFRRRFLEESRKGSREFDWEGETIILEPYVVGFIHEYRSQKFLKHRS